MLLNRNKYNQFAPLEAGEKEWARAMPGACITYAVVGDDEYALVQAGYKRLCLLSTSTGELAWKRDISKEEPVQAQLECALSFDNRLFIEPDDDWLVMDLATGESVQLDVSWSGDFLWNEDRTLYFYGDRTLTQVSCDSLKVQKTPTNRSIWGMGFGNYLKIDFQTGGLLVGATLQDSRSDTPLADRPCSFLGASADGFYVRQGGSGLSIISAHCWDGTPRFEVELGDYKGGITGFSDAGSGPVVVSTSGHGTIGGEFIALDREKGNILWRFSEKELQLDCKVGSEDRLWCIRKRWLRRENKWVFSLVAVSRQDGSILAEDDSKQILDAVPTRHGLIGFGYPQRVFNLGLGPG